MNSENNIDDVKNIKFQNRGVKEIVNSLLQTPFGIHQIVVYPKKYEVLQEAYFYYIKKLLEDYNEIVIFLTHYESAESVKNVLISFFNNNKNQNDIDNSKDKKKENKQQSIDVDNYIKNGSLVIIDSDKAFSNGEGRENEKAIKIINNNNQIDNNNNNNFTSLVRMSVSHAKKLKKEGITILADYGFVYIEKGFEGLIDLEKSIPYTLDNINIKQICLYNQNDFFHKFTKQQKKEILDLHSRSIIMMDS